MGVGSADSGSALLFDRIVALGRLRTALGRFPVSREGRSYVVLLGLITVDFVLNIFLFTSGSSAAISVGWVLIPVGLLVGLAIAKHLRRRYQAVLADAGGGTQSLYTKRLQLAILGIVLTGYVLYWLFQPEWTSRFFTNRGPVIGTVQLTIIGPLYVVVLVDVFTTVLVSTLLMPVHLIRGDISPDFSDPSGFAGLFSYGKLIERAIVLYFFGVILYSVWLVQEPGSVVIDFGTEGRFMLFVFIWSFGVVLYLVPTVASTVLLERQKEHTINQLDRQIRELGEDDRGLLQTNPGDEALTCIQQELAIQRVRSSRRVPVPSSQFVFTAGASLLIQALKTVPQFAPL